MTKRSFRQRFIRTAMVVAVGGSAFQLSGCDPVVRGTILAGLESTTQTLSSTLITALFLGILDDDGSSSGITKAQ